MLPVLVTELVKVKQAATLWTDERGYTTLAHTASLYCGSEARGPKVRDRLLELAVFGLVRLDLPEKPHSYEVSIGPLGEEFYKNVLFVAMAKKAPRYIAGKQEELAGKKENAQ